MIHRILIHPDDPDIVVIGVTGPSWGDSEGRGVYKTTDGGSTWTKTLYVNNRTGVADLVMDPSNPSHMLVAMWEHLLNTVNINKNIFELRKVPLKTTFFFVLTVCATVMANNYFPTDLPTSKWEDFKPRSYSQAVTGVIYDKDSHACCSVPMGGVATGCIDVDMRGVWGYSSILTHLRSFITSLTARYLESVRQLSRY